MNSFLYHGNVMAALHALATPKTHYIQINSIQFIASDGQKNGYRDKKIIFLN